MTNNHEETLADIKQNVLINAPIQKVWKYVSTAEGIEAWLMPNDFKLEEGYTFHIQSPFGPSPCKVIEIDAPNRIVFEWDTDGWLVTFTLKEVGDQTEFTLIHGGWKHADAIVPKAQQPQSVIRNMMEQGWVGLVQHKFKQTIEG